MVSSATLVTLGAIAGAAVVSFTALFVPAVPAGRPGTLASMDEFTPWSDEDAARYRAAGIWRGCHWATR